MDWPFADTGKAENRKKASLGLPQDFGRIGETRSSCRNESGPYTHKEENNHRRSHHDRVGWLDAIKERGEQTRHNQRGCDTNCASEADEYSAAADHSTKDMRRLLAKSDSDAVLT